MPPVSLVDDVKCISAATVTELTVPVVTASEVSGAPPLYGSTR